MIGVFWSAYNSATMYFELGDPDRPRGHALLYFRDSSDPARLWATYLVVPPIAMDLAKYIPPLLASQLPAGLSGMPNVYPLPPFPEAVESHAYLAALAEARDDDLLDGGTLSTGDLQRIMLAVSESAERYAARYVEAREREVASQAAEQRQPPKEADDLDVDAILLEVMTASEKVGRLARSLGTLRYALEGDDTALAQETLSAMEKVGRRLDQKFRVAELLEAARQAGERGRRLSELYVERCYKLAGEDPGAVAELDRRIAELQSSDQQGEPR